MQEESPPAKMFRLYGRTLNLARTAVHYLIFISLGLMVAIPGPTLLDLQRYIGEKSSDSMGLIFTIRSSGYLVGSLFGGIFLDYIHRKELPLILSITCLSIGTFIIPWCNDFSQMMAAFALIGFAMGFSNTGSNVCCLSTCGKNVAPVLQGLHFCYGLGGLLAPLIATAFLAHNPVVPDLTLLGVSRNFSTESEYDDTTTFSGNTSDIELRLSGSEATFLPSIIYTYSTIGIFTACVTAAFILVTVISSDETSVADQDTNVTVKQPTLTFTVIVIFLAALQAGLISSVEVSFSQILSLYAVKGAHKLSKATASLMTSTYWGTFTVARVITIFVAMKLSSVTILLFDFFLSLSAVSILLTVGTWSETGLWVGTCFLGAGVASFFPGVLSWIKKYININNKMVSVFTVISSIFEMTVPMTINFYLQTKPNILFEYMLGAIISSFLLFGVLLTILKMLGKSCITIESPSNVQSEKEREVPATSYL